MAQNLLIGAVAKRTGLAVSAIRHYEAEGLVSSGRDRGGRRVFSRSDIRRISFVIAAQRLGFTLREIKLELDKLPDQRTPTKADWVKISRSFGKVIEQRIADLSLMREKLDGCIGCGCLSLKNCALYNPDDEVAKTGAGPRFLIQKSTRSNS